MLLLAGNRVYTTNLYHDTAPICIVIVVQKYWGTPPNPDFLFCANIKLYYPLVPNPSTKTKHSKKPGLPGKGTRQGNQTKEPFGKISSRSETLVSRGRCGREIARLRRLATVFAASFLRSWGQPQKSLAASDFLRPAKRKPCNFCSGMVASPLAATVVTAILRCDFRAAKSERGQSDAPQQAACQQRQKFTTPRGIRVAEHPCRCSPECLADARAKNISPEVSKIIEFFRGRPRRGDNFMSLFLVLQTLYSKRQKHPFWP